MEEAIEETVKWMEDNQEAETEELKQQKKKLEDVVQPIIAKLYQGSQPPPSESGDEKDEL